MGFRCTILIYFEGAVIPSPDFKTVVFTCVSKDTTKVEGGLVLISGEGKNNKPKGTINVMDY